MNYRITSNLNRETSILCDVYKGRFVILINDFILEGDLEKGYSHLKKDN